MIVFFYFCCRKFFYEIFFCVHQIVIVFFISAFENIFRSRHFIFDYICISCTKFFLLFVLHVMIFLYHNKILRNHLFRTIFNQNKEIVKFNMNFFRSLKIRVKQYINLWISSINFWSFLQNHSFMMISWFQNKPQILEFLIESRRNLTKFFFHYLKFDETKIIFFWFCLVVCLMFWFLSNNTKLCW